MTESPRQMSLKRSLGDWCWRGMWLVLLLGHAFLWLRVCARVIDESRIEDIWTLLVLSGANAFFVAKLLEVSWLSWGPQRFRFVVFLIVVALTHRATADATRDALTHPAPIILMTGLTLEATRVLRRVVRRLIHVWPPPSLAWWKALCVGLADWVLQVPPPRFPRAVVVARGPPC